MPVRDQAPSQGTPHPALHQGLLAALDQVPEAMALVDGADGSLLHANRLFIETFGLAGTWPLPSRLEALFEPDEGGKSIAAAVEQARSGTGWMGRALLKPRKGSPVRVEGSLCPVRGGSGGVESVVVRLKDLSMDLDRNRNLRLAQKMSALGTLAGGVAHDFNNLICAILAATEQVEQQVEAGSPICRKLAIIQQAGERARGLTAQILNFGRRSHEAWTDIDLSDLLGEVAGLMRATAPGNVEVVTDLAPDIHVLGDPSQLHQVVMNLGINATQAMQPGGGTLLLQLQRLPAGSRLGERPFHEPCVELLVEDTGCGMDAPTLERIFEPFFTTKGDERGTGLGLSVVYDIIQGHGGLLQVASTPGKGTSFRVFFPQNQERRPFHQPLATGVPSRLTCPPPKGRTAGG